MEMVVGCQLTVVSGEDERGKKKEERRWRRLVGDRKWRAKGGESGQDWGGE
jgi:hypothetical protein